MVLFLEVQMKKINYFTTDKYILIIIITLNNCNPCMANLAANYDHDLLKFCSILNISQPL